MVVAARNVVLGDRVTALARAHVPNRCLHCPQWPRLPSDRLCYTRHAHFNCNPVAVWQRCCQFWYRCGSGTGVPSPGADVAGASQVPAGGVLAHRTAMHSAAVASAYHSKAFFSSLSQSIPWLHSADAEIRFAETPQKLLGCESVGAVRAPQRWRMRSGNKRHGRTASWGNRVRPLLRRSPDLHVQQPRPPLVVHRRSARAPA
jgi:hypothetical protein